MTDMTDNDIKDAVSGKLGKGAQEIARQLLELMDTFRGALEQTQRFGDEPERGTVIAWEKHYRVGDTRAIARSSRSINDAFDDDDEAAKAMQARVRDAFVARGIYSPAGPTRQSYLYVAVCIDSDMWYLTGRRTNPVTWEKLVDLIGDAEARMSNIADWEVV